jgi:putative hydrolase
VTGPPGFPGGFDPSALGEMFGRLQRIFSGPQDEGPVNWLLARDVALEAIASAPGGGAAVVPAGPRIGFGAAHPAGTPTVPPGEADAVAAAARVADTWLDGLTAFPAAATACRAWTPQEWVTATLPTWRTLVGPVAERMAGAMSGTLSPGEGLPPGLPPEAAGLMAQAGPMLQRLGGGLLGMQLGEAIGAMALEVTGAHDVGYPLAGSTSALLPRAVAATAADTGLDPDEVRLFLACRELAHARLFAAAPWLAPTLLAGIERYAAGIDLDANRIREAIAGIDPTDPTRLQEALSEGVLEPPTTQAQRAALAHLEHLLALVEGWVATVTGGAARLHVPHAESLLEHQRRRRAVGGPAERTFGALVGLELRPRRMREAAAWWAARGDAEARDRLWAHPDLLPSDLGGESAGDDAAGRGPTDGDLDAELRDLLDEEGGGRA